MEKLRKNREIAVLLVVLAYLYLIITFVGCTDKFTDKFIGNRQMIEGDLSVGLVAENFEDKAFGENGKKGLEEAKEKKGIIPEYVTIPKDEVKDEMKNGAEIIRKTAGKNAVTIALGAPMKTDVQKVAREMRNKNFVIIDEQIEEPNVKSIMFKHEEGAFLMGIVAGKETKANSVGFIGGMSNEDGERFLSGYSAGVKTVNEKAAVDLLNRANSRYLENFYDVDQAYNKAKELYQTGCDIIFQCAGKAGEGVFKAAKELGKKAIGVDVDQAKTFKDKYEGVIISSMIKNVDKVVIDVCDEVAHGRFESGIANIKRLGVDQDILDYAPSTSKYVNKDTIKLMNDYKEKIKIQDIEVPSKFYEVIEFSGSKK